MYPPHSNIGELQIAFQIDIANIYVEGNEVKYSRNYRKFYEKDENSGLSGLLGLTGGQFSVFNSTFRYPL